MHTSTSRMPRKRIGMARQGKKKQGQGKRMPRRGKRRPKQAKQTNAATRAALHAGMCRQRCTQACTQPCTPRRTQECMRCHTQRNAVAWLVCMLAVLHCVACLRRRLLALLSCGLQACLLACRNALRCSLAALHCIALHCSLAALHCVARSRHCIACVACLRGRLLACGVALRCLRRRKLALHAYRDGTICVPCILKGTVACLRCLQRCIACVALLALVATLRWLQRCVGCIVALRCLRQGLLSCGVAALICLSLLATPLVRFFRRQQITEATISYATIIPRTTCTVHEVPRQRSSHEHPHFGKKIPQKSLI